MQPHGAQDSALTPRQNEKTPESRFSERFSGVVELPREDSNL